MQLVVNTFGACLRKEGERFLVQAGERRLAVSAHKVRSIVVATGALLSTDAIELAVAHNVDILFLSRSGEPYGRVWQNRLGSTAAIRKRQTEAATGPEGLDLARNWVGAKLRHQQEFLEELLARRQGMEEAFASPLATLKDCRGKLAALTGTLEERRGTIMGLEGLAGRVYFDLLSRLLPEEWRFAGRSRQPARDGFNAMLNYGYGVLYGLVDRACILAGLDPFVGFLHTDNYGKKSLVFDLIEPFRILAERAVVLVFTGRRVRKEYFAEVPGGTALNKEGRAFFLDHFQERLEQTVRWPVQGKPGKSRNVKVRDTVQYEAHSLANFLLGRKDLPTAIQTRKIWQDRPEEMSTAAAPVEPPPDPDDECRRPAVDAEEGEGGC